MVAEPVAYHSQTYSKELHHYLLGYLLNLPKRRCYSEPKTTTLLLREEIAAEIMPLLEQFLVNCLHEHCLPPITKVSDPLGTKITIASEGLFLALEQAKSYVKRSRVGSFGVKEPFVYSHHFWRGAAEVGALMRIVNLPPEDCSEKDDAQLSKRNLIVFETQNGKLFLESFSLWLRHEIRRGGLSRLQGRVLPPYRLRGLQRAGKASPDELMYAQWLTNPPSPASLEFTEKQASLVFLLLYVGSTIRTGARGALWGAWIQNGGIKHAENV